MIGGRRNMLAVATLLALGPLAEWRERLATWCDAAVRYVQQCGGTVHDALAFSTVAYNARREGNWHEHRLREVAAFVHREMVTFQAFVDAGTPPPEAGTTWPAPLAERHWPSARGERDEGDGVR